jgi:hypothetical protein
MDEGNYNLVYPSPWDFQEFFYMPQNLTTWDLPALLSIREEGVLRIFIGFEPATFGSSGRYTNHYTIKATERPVTNRLSYGTANL